MAQTTKIVSRITATTPHSTGGFSLLLRFPLATMLTFCTIIRKSDMLVEFSQSLVLLTHLKCLNLPHTSICTNFLFLHELLRTRALWRTLFKKFFRLFKPSKNPQLHCKHVLLANLPKCVAQMQLCQMI